MKEAKKGDKQESLQCKNLLFEIKPCTQKVERQRFSDGWVPRLEYDD